MPYLVFEVKGKLFMIDAYFSKKVEKIEHTSVLIRKLDKSLPKTAENPLPKMLDEENIESFLKDAFEKIYELSNRKFDERLKHIRKWNIHRIIGISSGFKKHKEKEEELAKENREALLALALLQEILRVKNPIELKEVTIKPVEWRYYALEIRNNEVYDEKRNKDLIYTELLKRDKGISQALYALEYSQHAT